MNDKWLKATVVGSLWAAIEIVVGSFLHNLRVPFAGSILAFSSVILVVAFLCLWKEKGIAIRAAAIAALMKSISPSAVIIGPMTGIFLEGAIIELFITLLGVNRLALILGGALAVWSALLHKLTTLIIVYGGDLVEILDNLYRYAVRQLGITSSSLWEPIALISLIYLAIGAFAALLGMRINPNHEVSIHFDQKGNGQNLFELTEKNQYSVVMLFLVLTGMIGVMVTMNLSDPLIYLPFSGLFLGFLSFKYKRALRPLTRPKFWTQLVIITFLAALLIDGLETKQWFAWHGIQAGLLINLRALTVLMSFAAIGMELKNPLIKSILYRRGLAPLYSSLQMAFSALPNLMSHLPARIKRIKDIPKLAREFLGVSQGLYAYYSALYEQRPKVYLIVGSRQSGKTTFLKKLVQELKRKQLNVGGFIARASIQDEQVAGYRLQVIDTGSEQDFCMRSGDPSWDKIGRFYIDPAGMKLGMSAFEEALKNPPDVFVVDEVGPLEMKDRGWSSGIQKMTQSDQTMQIWSVRTTLAKKVVKKWPEYQFELINPDQKLTPQNVAEQLSKNT